MNTFTMTLLVVGGFFIIILLTIAYFRGQSQRRRPRPLNADRDDMEEVDDESDEEADEEEDDDEIGETVLPGIQFFPGSLSEFEHSTGTRYRIVDTGFHDKGVWLEHDGDDYCVTSDCIALTNREQRALSKEKDCDDYIDEDDHYAAKLTKQLKVEQVVALINVKMLGDYIYGLPVSEKGAAKMAELRQA